MSVVGYVIPAVHITLSLLCGGQKGQNPANEKNALSLVLFALLTYFVPTRVEAVVPAPDGGYPKFTTAEGQKALFNLTTGSANTAVGP